MIVAYCCYRSLDVRIHAELYVELRIYSNMIANVMFMYEHSDNELEWHILLVCVMTLVYQVL